MSMQYLGVTIPITWNKTSKQWPSENPNDRFEKFVCDLCKWELLYEMYGSFPTHDMPSMDRAIDIMLRHQDLCKNFKPKGNQ